MKKIVLLMFLVCAALTVNAQVYGGGTLSFWNNDDADLTNYAIAPEIGYNFNSKWAVGAELGYVHNETSLNDVKLKLNSFYFAPYARYSYYENGIVRLFFDGGVGISSVKLKGADSTTGFEIGVRPGLAIKLNDTFNIISKIGFVGYRDDYAFGNNGFGLALSGSDISFGLLVNF